MARIRSMKPEWVSSHDMRQLSAGGVVLWWALVSQADDAGRLHADVNDLALLVAAWADRQEVETQLQRMSRQRMIRRYRVKGQPYLLLVNWHHQHIEKPRASRLPSPNGVVDESRSRRRRVGDSSVTRRGSVGDSSVNVPAPRARGGSDLIRSDQGSPNSSHPPPSLPKPKIGFAPTSVRKADDDPIRPPAQGGTKDAEA